MVFRVRKAPFLLALVILGGTGCGTESSVPQLPEGAPVPEGAQAVSLLGEPLFPPVATPEVQSRRQEQLQAALSTLESDPTGAESIIWAARRHAYMGEYRKAIELFSEGMQHHPDDARFYRHRGHRFISVREFDLAIADFRKAAELIEGTADEVEPDGQPNAQGIPTSTLHFNIWYHYGLAHFIKGDFEAAVPIYEICMAASEHPDSKVATAHWLYMSLRRAGRDVEAAEFIAGLDLDGWEPQVIESGSYFDLLRLYQAAKADPNTEVNPNSMDGAALGYGIGNFFLYTGRTEEAVEVFQGMLEAGDQWASFGFIAAEADLARLRVE
jgi:tetratricopeptide (TPR) repeat protein